MFAYMFGSRPLPRFFIFPGRSVIDRGHLNLKWIEICDAQLFRVWRPRSLFGSSTQTPKLEDLWKKKTIEGLWCSDYKAQKELQLQSNWTKCAPIRTIYIMAEAELNVDSLIARLLEGMSQ